MSRGTLKDKLEVLYLSVYRVHLFPVKKRVRNENRDLSKTSTSDWMAAPEAPDGEAEKNCEEREGDLTSLLVQRAHCRESARHLISEIPNIFKSTGADARGGGVSRSRRFTQPQRRTSLSTAIKIRIIIIRATAEWSVRSQTKRSSVSAKRRPLSSHSTPYFPHLSFFVLSFLLDRLRAEFAMETSCRYLTTADQTPVIFLTIAIDRFPLRKIFASIRAPAQKQCLQNVDRVRFNTCATWIKRYFHLDNVQCSGRNSSTLFGCSQISFICLDIWARIRAFKFIGIAFSIVNK